MPIAEQAGTEAYDDGDQRTLIKGANEKGGPFGPPSMMLGSGGWI